MLDEGHHREALVWAILFALSSTDVILTDGPAAAKPVFAVYQTRFLQTLGMDEPDVRAARFAEADRLADRIFALAEEIVTRHPDVVD